MPHYATLQLRKVDGQGFSGDQLAEELMRGQGYASWGRDWRLMSRADCPQLYDASIDRLKKKVEKRKGKFEILDARDVVVRVTERRKYKRRAPRAWTGYLRIVEVDVTPRLLERVSAEQARRAGIAVKGGLITP
jgi:hypothetical protein